MWSYRCRVDRVIDGDTLDLTVDLGFHIEHRIRVRLQDIDTPEIRGPERPDGLAAKQFVEEWVNSAGLVNWPFVVRTHKTGKYGRWLADLWHSVQWVDYPDEEPVSLVEALTAAGFDWSDQ